MDDDSEMRLRLQQYRQERTKPSIDSKSSKSTITTNTTVINDNVNKLGVAKRTATVLNSPLPFNPKVKQINTSEVAPASKKLFPNEPSKPNLPKTCPSQTQPCKLNQQEEEFVKQNRLLQLRIVKSRLEANLQVLSVEAQSRLKTQYTEIEELLHKRYESALEFQKRVELDAILRPFNQILHDPLHKLSQLMDEEGVVQGYQELKVLMETIRRTVVIQGCNDSDRLLEKLAEFVMMIKSKVGADQKENGEFIQLSRLLEEFKCKLTTEQHLLKETDVLADGLTNSHLFQ